MRCGLFFGTFHSRKDAGGVLAAKDVVLRSVVLMKKGEGALSFHHAREVFAEMLDSVNEEKEPEKHQLYRGLTLLAEGFEYDFNMIKNRLQQLELEMRKLEARG